MVAPLAPPLPIDLDLAVVRPVARTTHHDGVLDRVRQTLNGLLAELRRRGIVAEDYTGPTLRENLGLDRPDRVPATIS